MKNLIVKFLSFVVLLGLGSAAFAQSVDEEAAAIALAQPAIVELQKSLPVDTTFKPRRVFFDKLGQVHIRVSQFYKNIPVFEGEAIIHIDWNTRQVIGTTKATLSFKPITTVPAIAADRAQEISRTHFKQQLGIPSQKELHILVKDGVGQLAWKVHSEGDVPEGRVDTIAFVGAQSGGVLRSWNNLHNSDFSGTAKGMYIQSGGVSVTVDKVNNTTYYLRNAAGGGLAEYFTCDMRNGRFTCYYVTNSTATFGDGKISSKGPTAAADAHYGATQTLNYFSSRFSRAGIDAAGEGGLVSYSRVHYGQGYENAFWSDSCFCMTYGDGKSYFYPLVSLDVAGHEMAHGVTSREANLIYSGESGGLNEATSDIFGTMVEFYTNQANSSAIDKPDYLIGEMILRSNWNKDLKGNPTSLKSSGLGALRYMHQPSLDGASADCWYSGIGAIDVHYSSGVANHFFYLLAEGSAPASGPASPTCNSSTVTGIGAAKAEQIWYRALTVYMTKSTTYADARQATLDAATDLYPTETATIDAVKSAWSAVNVN